MFRRGGSKLVNDGEITFYQFMIAFMGVYFSGIAAGTLFSFVGSKSNSSIDTFTMFQTSAAKGFARGIQAANYYFWLSDLEQTIMETETNKDFGPSDGCRSYELKDLQFSCHLAPDNKISNGVSMEVSTRKAHLIQFA